MKSNTPDSPMFSLLNKVKAQFTHIGEVKSNLDGISKLLDKLTDLGDVVTEDDIVKTAGQIVGKGWMPADQMAGILADMPPNGGGTALAKWVLAHDIQIKQQLLQVTQLQEMAGHQMGVTAHQAVVEALTGREPPDVQGGGQAPGPQSSNPLTSMPTAGSA